MIIRLLIALILAAALTVGAALLEGNYLNRWGTPIDLTAAAHEVENFPREFGGWTFERSGEPLSPAIIHELGLAGYISRTYLHRDSGTLVSLLLMVGQPGPLLRHPPDICYANRANVQVGEAIRFGVTATNPESEFKLLEVQASSIVGRRSIPGRIRHDRGPILAGAKTAETRVRAAPKLYKAQLLIAIDPSQKRENVLSMLQLFANDFCARFQQLPTAAL